MKDLKLTNTGKIFWPVERYTKGDVINYYQKVSDTILPHLKDRPQSLYRQPNGIKGGFFQKNIKSNIPSFVKTVLIPSSHLGKEINFMLCQNLKTLLYMANLGCIELNPWMSRIKKLEFPDFFVIDLDPGENISFECVVEAALGAHKTLDEIGANNFIKTSGKRGLHIFVPLGAKYDYEQVRHFSQLIALLIHNRKPKFTSLERNPQKRKNKIYLDYLQNRIGQTITAPYSLRPISGAPVSTPLFWHEVKKDLRIFDYNINTIFKRLDDYGDIWKNYLQKPIKMESCLSRINKIYNI